MGCVLSLKRVLYAIRQLEDRSPLRLEGFEFWGLLLAMVDGARLLQQGPRVGAGRLAGLLLFLRAESVPCSRRCLRPGIIVCQFFCFSRSGGAHSFHFSGANDANGKASFLSEEDRAIEAAQAGDIAAVKAFLDRGGYVELRDSRLGMVRNR